MIENFVERLKPERLIAQPGKTIKLKDYSPEFTGDFRGKKSVSGVLQQGIQALAEYQDMLYAQNIYALLIIFQAMDAAGKDSTIKHVMSGINPQGCQVFSFKAPSAEELDHDYLWRSFKALPERGRIGIFNRSYYEEVLVVRVHPELLSHQQLPPTVQTRHIWDQRFEEINNFEKYLVNNGIIVIKFFLNVSKDKQKKRFLKRINRPDKNWKLSVADAKERSYWDEYMHAYEEMLTHTSTIWAPWYIIPANHKWYSRLAVAYFIYQKMESLDLHYPTVSEEHRQRLQDAKEMLENEA